MNRDRREADPSPGLGRRDFLKRAAAMGAGLALGVTRRAKADEASAATSSERRNERPDVTYRRLGRTDLMVSALTFGSIKLGVDNLRVLDAAVEQGVNLVHTNMGYSGGKSIRALGQWLKTPGHREKIFLALKPRCEKVSETRLDLTPIDEELEILGTDHVDLLMVPIHEPGPVLDEAVREQFQAMRDAGKARRMGLTFHSNLPEVFENGVKAGWYDVFQPTYNLPSRDVLKPLLAKAKDAGIGLVTMKSVKGLPRGEDPVPTWQQFLDDGIDTVLRTMTTTDELDRYMRLARKSEPAVARAALADCTGQCTLCGRCAACPQGVAIQDALRIHQYYGEQLGWMDEARAQYARIPRSARAAVCADCGRCEEVCPQGLAVRSLVRAADRALA